uniref:ShKT domain-containing protein n=1 Tax=Ascaris lumbricoides TaxID=6252 RepID=A0A0M3IL52_ASCLU
MCGPASGRDGANTGCHACNGYLNLFHCRKVCGRCTYIHASVFSNKIQFKQK